MACTVVDAQYILRQRASEARDAPIKCVLSIWGTKMGRRTKIVRSDGVLAIASHPIAELKQYCDSRATSLDQILGRALAISCNPLAIHAKTPRSIKKLAHLLLCLIQA
jgi:hypothetical protein